MRKIVSNFFRGAIKKKMLIIYAVYFCVFSSSVYSAKPNELRLIALAPHVVEMLYLLGVGDQIVATTSFADYPEEAKKIPVIGGYNGIQIERVLTLKPDLVIAWEGGNKKDDLEQLERLGIKVYRTKTDKLEEIAVELKVIGRLVGREAEAEKESALFLKQLSEIRQQNQNKVKVKFFYQLWNEPLRAMAAESWINSLVEGCGAVNIFDQSNGDYPQVSIENIISGMPEIIIIPSHHGHGLGEGDFWKKWPEIPAVKTNSIIYVDGDLLHRFSVRSLLGMDNVCAHIDKLRNVKNTQAH